MHFITFAPVRKVKQIITACLALTFFVMALVPCADACDNNSHKVEVSVQSAQEHHEEHNNICSPLCYCACCSTLITLSHFYSVSLLAPEIDQIISAFEQPFVSSCFSDIWQPPKIS